MKDGDPVVGWYTKHALTSGIMPMVGHYSGGYVYMASKPKPRGSTVRMTPGVDFFVVRDEAIAKAMKMAQAELNAAQTRVAKMRRLRDNPKFER